MTYTFKLARRLAVSRDFGVLAAIALLAACSGDATAPDAGSSSPSRAPASLQVFPRSVTIETHQRVQFRGQSRGLRGEPVVQPVVWGATGGVIGTDGTFSSAVPGTFKVIGRGWRHTDSSTVVVVPPPADLDAIVLTPDSAAVQAGGQVAFTALGRLRDGTLAPVGVRWSATGGGAVDPDGLFNADSTAGTYRVIAASTRGNLADTGVVVVSRAAGTAVSQIEVIPAAITLTPGATQRFRAFGRSAAGDSVAVAVTFSATGGTINANGLYTAGQTSGTFRVKATAASVTGTASVRVEPVAAPAPTAPSGTGASKVLGTLGLFNLATSTSPGVSTFNLSQDSYNSSNILSRIDAARSKGMKIMLAMTGGKHENYLTDGVFDRSKWEAKLQTYNTAAIRQAIAAGVADGTILGATVMDEPHVSGLGDGNTWGPRGTMTKARVDSLCADVKAMFPTLPAGVQHRWDKFEPSKSYRVCDFLTTQYSNRIGDLATWRDGGLAMARRDGHAILFSMNILNGGVQDLDGTWDCTGPGQGGKGSFSPNCRMTPAQLREYGLALGPAGCAGLLTWRYDDTFMANADNQAALKAVRDRLATLPATPCRRQ